MFKFVLVSAVLVASLKGAYSGLIGHESYGGGDDSYGGSINLGGEGYGSFDSGAALTAGDQGAAGAGLQQSGGSGGGDFHGGTSVVGGSSQQQATVLDLTGGEGHGHKVYGGSFISAGVSGKSGSYGEEGGDGGFELGGHEGLSAYSGHSSYDAGDGGEITGVLSASVKGEPDEAFYHHY